MRAFAADLRSAANALGDACANIDGCVRGLEFIGPAGDRFRGRMHGVDGDIKGAVDRLHDIARRLEHSADEVDAAQRAHDEAVTQNELEALHELHRLNSIGIGGVR